MKNLLHLRNFYHSSFVYQEVPGDVDTEGQTPKAQKPLEEIEASREAVLKKESSANAPHTIADAMQLFEQTVGEGEWTLPNGEALAQNYETLRSELPNLSDLMQNKVAVGSPDAVNAFLEENEFDIRLEDQNMEGAVYTASVLDIRVKWDKRLAGKAGKMNVYKKNPDGSYDYDNKREVDSVDMTVPKENILSVEGHEYEIVKLDTQGDNTVYMTRYDGVPPQGAVALQGLVSTWMDDVKPSTGSYTGKVEFPMVDFNKEGDIMELQQGDYITDEGYPYIVAEAKYQHILKINELGAIAKAASALTSMPRGLGGPKSVDINGNFLVWFERDGIIPFSAYISEKDMKAPQLSNDDLEG